MTNIQAINLLKGLEQSLDDYCELNDEGKTAFGMVITALELFGNSEQLPSAPESRREWYMKGYRDAQDAALHDSCTDCPLYDHDRHNCPRFNKVIPTAIMDAQQRWIPVKERLPKKDGRYQVTRYDYVTNTEFIDILWYEENFWWNRHSTGDYAVTAWMPLPESYKEGQE